ncbi:menaquinol-cytochrome c reductase cytochrome b subunit [Salsipaludibacter albus]|uniref:menaquinol-cytochrome c reductase cytochrome b subunit n=1 Tax=Salsipaludibacter albus TaxID=2849650 RepID=UPI001EE3E2AD|nr:menaquinol-cytochrome c reductase cytochrome b subunit [Salsipaludibacter albus]MBY5161084.1 menaquinol-cytochrome c reductase cytochrome b subunit [Salsipaludibacter albus]
MAEVQIDQATYDALTSQGVPDRIARAKAKAATVRKEKQEQGVEIGPKSADQATKALAEFRENFGGSGGGTATATAVADAPSGRLTPEERAARVRASLGQTNGSPSIGVPADSKHTHRLLALVPPSGIQQVSDKQQDKVYTWPHLLLVEFVALLAMGAVLLVVSYFIDATFRELANPNLTPNPSKAPWYFLGLQELLRYFHPMVAGVTIPGVGLIALGATAYMDKNPSAKPENRKFANMSMTFFMCLWTVFVFAGSFFRGPGFNWVWPWVDGLFFEL